MKRAIFMLLGVCACQGAPVADAELPAMTQVFAGFDAYDALGVQGGLVSAEISGSGVVACPVGGCEAPTVVAWSDSYVSGELPVVDASGDRAIATGLVYPSWVATSGARTFVAEDSFSYDETPARVDSVADDGTVTPWIQGVGGGTYGLLADAANVYVLVDDPTLSSVQLLACATSHPCFSEPRVLLGDLDQTITAQQLASDGVAVYVARALVRDVVRINASGNVTTILPATDATALVWDAATNALWFGTSAGSVGRVSADGTMRTYVAHGAGAIHAIATDATSVYVSTGESGELVMRAPKS